ncbi:MAG: serine/threonine-protein kinase [Myxococcaceae bacterium]
MTVAARMANVNPPHEPNSTADATGADGESVATVLAAPPGEPAQRGDLIGERYFVLGPLGRGGMGIVYEAADKSLARSVALKFVRSGKSSSADDQLYEEGQRMAKLQPHSNVVVVYDCQRYLGQVCLVLQFIDGKKTLRQWEDEKPRHWREVLAMYRQAGEGLLHAHVHDQVHRDFKAANVLLDGKNEPHVSDFGLARNADAKLRAADATSSGPAAGTPGYMSPEQIGKQGVTPASDQFSFCAALYRALYGELPFGVRQELPLPPVGAPPKGRAVPGWVREVLLKGLQVDPAARHRSMRELLDALANDPAPRRRVYLAAISGVFLLGLVSLGAALAWRAATADRRACEAHSASTFEQIFGAKQQESIRDAFVKANPANGAADFERVRVRLAPEANSWRGLSTEACRLSDQGKKRMQSCLEERRKTLQTISTMFASADERIEEKSLSTVLSEVLPSAACLPGKTQNDAANAQSSASDDPLDEQLAKARVLLVAGKYEEASSAALDVMDEANNGNKPAVEAEARLLLGKLYTELYRPDADEYLRAASVLAEGVSEDRLRLDAALTYCAWYIDKGQAFYVQANDQLKTAEAILQRIGGNPLLSARVLTLRAQLAGMRGEDERAVTTFRAALELSRQLLPADHPEIARATINLALALPTSEAIPMLHEVRRSFEALYGPNHPEVGSVWRNIGFKCNEAKDWPCAIDALNKAVEMRRKTASYDPVRLANTLSELATALDSSGKHDSAIDTLREAIELLKKAGAPANKVVIELKRLHQLLLDAGHPSDELEEIDQQISQIYGTPAKASP